MVRVEHVYEDPDKLFPLNDTKKQVLTKNMTQVRSQGGLKSQYVKEIEVTKLPKKKTVEKKSFWQKRKNSTETSVEHGISKISSDPPEPEEHSYEIDTEGAHPLLPPRLYLNDPEFAGELKVIGSTGIDSMTSRDASAASDMSSLNAEPDLHNHALGNIKSKSGLYQPLKINKISEESLYATTGAIAVQSCQTPEQEPQYQNYSQLTSHYKNSGHYQTPIQCKSLQQRAMSRQTSNDVGVYQNAREYQNECHYENQTSFIRPHHHPKTSLHPDTSHHPNTR